MLIFKITFWTIINITSLFSALLHVIGWLRKVESTRSSLVLTISFFLLGTAALFIDLSEILNQPSFFKCGIIVKQFFIGILCYSLILYTQKVSSLKSYSKLLTILQFSIIPLLFLIVLYVFSPTSPIYLLITIISSTLLLICTGILILSKLKNKVSNLEFIIPIIILFLIPGFILENLKIHISFLNNFLPQGHFFLPLIILFRNGILFLINFKMLSKESTDIPLNNIFVSLLTPKEKEITTLFLIGKTYKEIGLKLKISPNTVGSHINNIYDKTGTSNRMELFSHLTEVH